jgi:nitroimidazol reductase NimA-like FMN-containing flavoprotein (pyridoxamine 5'-phosphate oxidase superfamily)
MSTDDLETTERTRLRRLRERGRFDRETVYSILDATPWCHVGTVLDGRPVVTPTFHWREGDHVYWHGSSASRALRAAEGADVCLTVSLLDGLVLARSGFHHSANYRSVMIFGRACKVQDRDEKLERLRNFIERLYPGRWDTLRPVTEQELKATAVLTLPIEEASAKLRTGHPVDDEGDYDVPVWAGIVPLRLAIDEPIRDPRAPAAVAEPGYLRQPPLG